MCTLCGHVPIVALRLAVALFLIGASLADSSRASDVVVVPDPEFLDFDVEERLAAGLVAEFASRSATSPIDMRKCRLAAIGVPAAEPPTPFLEPGPFQATLRGWLALDLTEEVAFSVVGHGELELSINGTVVLQGTGNLSELAATNVELPGGFNELRVVYRSPAEGDARFRLLWSSPNFLPEPIPPSLLKHDPQDPKLAEHLRLRSGRELLATRSCTKCHPLTAPLADNIAMAELARDNPNLSDAGSRLHPDWLYHWLLMPSSLRDHVTMPRLFDASDPAHQQQTRDLVAWLGELGSGRFSSDQANEDVADTELVNRGELLYEERGCIGCHRFTKPEEEDYYNRVSLHFVGAKFQSGALKDFLQRPHTRYAWSRMPDFSLTDAESAELAAFLREQSTGNLPQVDVTSGDPVSGREHFRSFGCANCHSLDDQPPQLQGPLQFLGQGNDAGCLQAAPDSTRHVPDFRFTAEERAALSSFLTTDGLSLTKSVPTEIASRYVRELRCATCHSRDGEMSRLPEVLYEESIEGRPPEAIPLLTWLGEKLYASWIEKQLAGRLTYRARPWLRIRMPAFPARANDLAEGLVAEHCLAADETWPGQIDPEKVSLGEGLTRQPPQGFFCQECHAIGSQKAAGAFDHHGVNFVHVAERLRRDFYDRWIMAPKRLDPASKMPQFSQDGQTTQVSTVLDGDARRQFDALWHYLQSLAAPEDE